MAILAANVQDLTAKAGEKDIFHRMGTVEGKVDSMIQARDLEAAKQQKDHEDLMAWIHPIAGAAGTAVITMVFQIIASKRREKRHAETLANVSQKVGTIEKHTDGMLQDIKELAFIKGEAKQKATEQEFSDGSVRGKLGRDASTAPVAEE